MDSFDTAIVLILFFVGFQADFSTAIQTVVPTLDAHRTCCTANFVAFVSTLLSNVLLLPVFTVFVLRALGDLPAPSALGIYLAALSPGGPLATIAAVGLGANSELNIVLTLSEQAASIVMIPIGVLIVMPVLVTLID